jgi:hypothetical protein
MHQLKTILCEKCKKCSATQVSKESYLCFYCKEIVRPYEFYDLERDTASPLVYASVL